MEQRRHILFIVVSMAMFIGWMQIAPVLFPSFFPQPRTPEQRAAEQMAALEQKLIEEQKKADAAKAVEEAVASEELGPLPEFPVQTVLLGGEGYESGYLIQAQLSTTGAAVDWVKLTDPRYTTIDRTEQLKVIGNEVQRNIGEGPVPRSFQSAIPQINALLAKQGKSLADVNWEIVDQPEDGKSVTFRYPSPDGKLEVRKIYRVTQADINTKDESPEGYMLDVEYEFKNLSEADLVLNYSMYGPVGLPLEDPENTRLFREIKLGTLEDSRRPDRVTAVTMLAHDLVKQTNTAANGGRPVNDWGETIHFAGVDMQFFAALVFPQGKQFEDANNDGKNDRLVSLVKPVLLERNDARPERSDMTITMESPELTVKAGETVLHQYRTFIGPKRPKLLYDMKAEPIIQLGWFSSVSKLMLAVLDFFHSYLTLPYAAAILLLTAVVKLLMYPISKKQAVEAEKMRVLAPKMKEIQEKHKGQPEEYMKALREFQKKYNYHPMRGCLPGLLQLPIFLGLYNALYHAVDLRLARFFWVDNLAAPDGLWHFGFALPWPLGWTELNILPILTVLLMVAQQKVLMPPPTSDEQAMQYRVMNFMMIAIGFAFYRVPAGLCLYFIASSLWGMGERLFLKAKLAKAATGLEGLALAAEGSGGVLAAELVKEEPAKKRQPPAWLQKMLSAADQARNATEGQGASRTDSTSSERKFSKGKKGKGPKPRR